MGKRLERQRFIRHYKVETGESEIDMHKVAEFAKKMGWAMPRPPSDIDLLAKLLLMTHKPNAATTTKPSDRIASIKRFPLAPRRLVCSSMWILTKLPDHRCKNRVLFIASRSSVTATTCNLILITGTALIRQTNRLSCRWTLRSISRYGRPATITRTKLLAPYHPLPRPPACHYPAERSSFGLPSPHPR